MDADNSIRAGNFVYETTLYSPLNKFKVVGRVHETEKGISGCAKVTIIRLADEKVIYSFVRDRIHLNSSFFVKDKEEWFQSGTTHDSQLFVNMDTGEVYNNEDAKDLSVKNFIWKNCRISPDGSTLAVSGIDSNKERYYFFFDFRDPKKGWPRLVCELIDAIEPEDKTYWAKDRPSTFVKHESYPPSVQEFIRGSNFLEYVPKVPDDWTHYSVDYVTSRYGGVAHEKLVSNYEIKQQLKWGNHKEASGAAMIGYRNKEEHFAMLVADYVKLMLGGVTYTLDFYCNRDPNEGSWSPRDNDCLHKLRAYQFLERSIVKVKLTEDNSS